MERKKIKAYEDGLYKVISDNVTSIFNEWYAICQSVIADKSTNEDAISTIEKDIIDDIEKENMKSLLKPTTRIEPIRADDLKKIQRNRPSIRTIKDQVGLYGTNANADARFETFRALKPSGLIDSEAMLKKRTNMRIRDYSYTEEDKITFDKEGNKAITPMMVTTITAYSMDTGVQTYTISHPKETADQYSGFAIAYATMCAGGKKEFNEMANYLMVKLPKIEAELEKKKKEAEIKEKRSLEKQKKAEIQREAKKLKMEYEAAKLAHEKYGVPMLSKFVEPTVESKTNSSDELEKNSKKGKK